MAQGKRGLPPPEPLPGGTVRYFLVLGEKCYPCVRYDLSPISQVAHSNLGSGYWAAGYSFSSLAKELYLLIAARELPDQLTEAAVTAPAAVKALAKTGRNPAKRGLPPRV